MSAPGALWVGLRSTVFIALCFLLVAGCETVPVPDTSMELSPDSLKLRQLQTRTIEGIDERALLDASAGVLQDLGFNIDESETRLGVIIASKERSAVDVGEIAFDLVISALLDAWLGLDTAEDISVDFKQKIRVCIVTRPVLDSYGQRRADAQALRITMQRLVWDTEDHLSHVQSIEDPKIYKQFFNRLSKSIFLELQDN
jgi:hypothetical protein